ncbi:MAG: MucB/RseB C-terminal domain-containing protein [Proteobacteria bacterium]|nr:MucB/RseB C-terminal domain-containing protein [Pseudomonadota bacterium]
MQRFRREAIALFALLAINFLVPPAWAGTASTAAPATVPTTAAEPAAQEQNLGAWLMRMQQASRQRSYVGTFVVTSSSGNMASARIWHAWANGRQIDRVESLTGTPRSTFQYEGRVVTFLPQAHVVRTEQRAFIDLFPNLLKSNDAALDAFYQAQPVGSDRVAGYDATAILIRPRDALRFGYRVWTENKTGLVVKVQTLDDEGHVLEQAAFSDLQIDAPVKMQALRRMMDDTVGYRLEKSDLIKTTAQAEGWTLADPVAGFRPIDCYKRPVADGGAQASAAHVMQCVFSDGLASVSLFVEPNDPRLQTQEARLAIGATQLLTRRQSTPSGDWWVTAVGEVPLRTLEDFVQGFRRVGTK